MRPTAERVISLGFAASLAAIAVIAIGAFRADGRAARDRAFVEHSHHLRETLSDVLADVVDAETGLRGFLITTDESYLAPLLVAESKLRLDLRALRDAALADADLTRAIDILEPIVDARMDRLAETLSVQRAGGFEAARARILTGEGKRLMDDVRELVNRLEAEEARRTRERQVVADRSDRMTRRIILLGVVAALLAGLLAVPLALRSLAERQRAAAMVRGVARLVDVAEDAILGWTLEGRLISWNPAAERLLGWTAAEAHGRDASFLAATGFPTSDAGLVERLRAGARVEAVELDLLRKQGGSVCCRVLPAAVQDEEGTVHALATFVRSVPAAGAGTNGLLTGLGAGAAALDRAAGHVRTALGLLPACAWCRRIRGPAGEWSTLEDYLCAHADADFTHGICPPCLERLRANDGRTAKAGQA